MKDKPQAAGTGELAVFRHKAVLICVNRSAVKRSLYDATRFAWKIDPSRAERADIVLAVVRGVIVGAFVAEQWMQATAANFPGRADGEGEPDRYGFVGHEATDEIQRLYIGKRVARKHGASNPIQYTWDRE